MLKILDARLQPFLIDLFRLSLWLGLLVAIFVPLERLFAAHPKKVFRKGIGVDLGYFFLSGLLPALILSVPAGLLAWSVRSLVPSGFLSMTAEWPLWGRALLGLVAGEIGYYWGHRWSHEIPFLWRFHAIHHAAEDLDFLVNTRAHPIDLVFGRFCGLVPLVVLGLASPTSPQGSQVPVIVTLLGTVWGYFLHANLKWRFGPTRMANLDPRVSSLAPHARRADQPQLRREPPVARPGLRHASPAERMAGRLRD